MCVARVIDFAWLPCIPDWWHRHEQCAPGTGSGTFSGAAPHAAHVCAVAAAGWDYGPS